MKIAIWMLQSTPSPKIFCEKLKRKNSPRNPIFSPRNPNFSRNGGKTKTRFELPRDDQYELHNNKICVRMLSIGAF